MPRRRRKKIQPGVPVRFRHPGFWLRPAWQQRSETDARLRTVLAPLLDAYLETAQVGITGNSNTVTILCQDRGSATEIRFLQREISKTLRAAGETQFTKVKITLVQVEDKRPEEPVLVRRELSRQTRALLLSTARSINNRRLAGALERLAKLPT